jgi:hypothetical protein
MLAGGRTLRGVPRVTVCDRLVRDSVTCVTLPGQPAAMVITFNKYKIAKIFFTS